MSKPIVICLILLLTGSISGYAQNISNLHFRSYQVNDGLSQNTVQTILQDSDGYLWVGTKDGLNKFDGTYFTVYRGKDIDPAIGNNSVLSIVEGTDRRLFIAMSSGLYIMNLDDETFEKVNAASQDAELALTSVYSLMLDRQGVLWIITVSQGVFTYDPSSKVLARMQSPGYDLTTSTGWCVYQDRSGIIWVGTRAGLFRYNASRGVIEPMLLSGGNTDREILSILEDENGNLWLGTWSGGMLLYSRRQNTVTAYCNKTSSSYYITHIRTFLQYDKSHLLVGADDGLYLFNTDNRQCKRMDVPYSSSSIGDQNVYALLRDREGGVWIGTYFGGLNYLNTSTLSMESYLPGVGRGALTGKAVSQFCEDASGNLWIATEDGGLNYFNTRTKEITQPIKTSYHNIHPLMIVEGELWIGTFSRGLDICNLKTRQMRNYRHQSGRENSLDDDCIFALYQAKNGDIYVGTTVGLNKYNPRTNDFTRIEAGKITFVYDIAEDDYGNLWIASYYTGAIKWDAQTDKWIYYSQQLTDHPIVNAKLTSVYIDNHKQLWLTSEGRGIFRYDYDTDTFLNISEADGLPNNVAYGILDDPLGNLWVSSNQGLASFSPSDMSRQTRYGLEDGLQSIQFNFKSSYKSVDGKFYFGGVNGFNSFYPQDISDDVHKNTAVPPVKIVNFRLLGDAKGVDEKEVKKWLKQKGSLKLDYSNSSFSISYNSLSYVSPGENQYAYRLDGIDNDWNYVGNNRNVSYVSLPPGLYTFRVKASNNNNVWNETGDAITFEILPPFWRSLPARICYLLLVLTAVTLALRQFLQRNSRRQALRLDSYKAKQEKLALKSKIDFFSTIAHEIRTPVSLIKAPLEEIISSGDGNNDTRRHLQTIEKNSERLVSLLDQMLDFRRLEASDHQLRVSHVDLIVLIREAFARFQNTAQEADVEVELQLPNQPELWLISDPDALMKIIENLLANAITYTQDRIVLKLDSQLDDRFIISISDNGIGLSDEQKAVVFDPFSRANLQEGEIKAGIGLYLAQHLSSLLDGTLEVDDSPMGGSVFRFSFGNLPEDLLAMQSESEPEEEPKEAAAEVVRSDQRSILIVDGNREMLQFIENTLKVHYNTETAVDTADALRKIARKSCDLVIADLALTDDEGMGLTRLLRTHPNHMYIPLIVLSTMTDNETKIKSLRDGADVFIEKPFSVSYLKAQIASLLTNRKTILEMFNRSPFISYSALTTNRNDDEFITRLNAEIDKHISDSDLSIEQLSDQLFISRSNLQRKLKAISGVTPGDYLRTYRLKKASILLLEKKLLINEVAYEVGFSSSSYFTKCFLKQFGVLPREFVKQQTVTSRKTDGEELL